MSVNTCRSPVFDCLELSLEKVKDHQPDLSHIVEETLYLVKKRL